MDVPDLNVRNCWSASMKSLLTIRSVRCTAAISYAADDIIQFPVIRVVNAQRATGNTHCLILLFLFHTIVLCSHMGELSTIKILHYLCSVGQYLIVTAMNVDNLPSQYFEIL